MSILALLKDVDDLGYYSLDELRTIGEVTQVVKDCWLCIRKDERDHVEFFLGSFSMCNLDESNVRLTLVFHGSGPSGFLREPRHIWWGPDGDGYTFYLPAGGVIAALTVLKEHFDFD